MYKSVILVLLLFPLLALSVRPDCGRGEIDCVGLCARFIDENSDGFCDIGGLSEKSKNEKSEVSMDESNSKPYRLILITALTLGLYALSALVKQFGVLTKTQHRRIWNILLLITFLMSGILGLVLVVQLNYQVLGDWYMSFLHLHVEFGIAMALISIIHALWHVSYYAKAFGIATSKKGKLRSTPFNARQSA